ncbi:hypothetical protein BH09GEM1_BH09GEM1_04600 [soil metagenome]
MRTDVIQTSTATPRYCWVSERPRRLLMSGCSRLVGAIVTAAVLASAPLHAQVRRSTSVDWLVSANSEGETYLRALRLGEDMPSYPWSIRSFSGDEIERLLPVGLAHPWASSFSSAPGAAGVRIFAPEAIAIFNTGFPFGDNDGAVWAGRGLTTAFTFGARFSRGPIDLQVAPQFFRAENADVPLRPNGQTGRLSFADADAEHRIVIDLPQRFGTAAYQRLDAGQSTLRVSVAGVAGGVSTANEFWGPAARDPFLLGNNAAGFPHLFAGTSHPIGLLGVTVHARAIAGKLGQSDYSSSDMTGRGRYLSGLVAMVTTPLLPGLEIGGGRLFHNVYADSNVSIAKVIDPLFHAFLKEDRARVLGSVTGDEPDNQLASLFARLTFPGSGVEIYGEFGREDSAFDLRDLLQEPDHDSSVLLGVQKVWRRSPTRLVQFRVESFSTRLTHLDNVRLESPAYVHYTITQGHTNLGQILGAPDGYGGDGAFLSIDDYQPGGRTSLQYVRSTRRQVRFAETLPGGPVADVLHSIALERLSFHDHFDFVRNVALVYELNRDLTHDSFNLKASASLRAHW